jgi:geranylgeranyl diphosphate synthase, type II
MILKLSLHEKFTEGLDKFISKFPSDGLYEPIYYLLNIHGKRMRPILALSVCEAEGTSIEKAMPVAIAVELFHNFTLMHDDIMDQASLRRGQLTAHEVYGKNAAILSGDAMFTLSRISLEDVKEKALIDILKIFNKTSREVCEGQQMDMEFENINDVTIDRYLEMIRLKTAVLFACSCAMGAIAAGVSKERVELWYRFGEQIGLAFQIQDDFLDTFGDSEITGKKIGGDILSEKKTFIWLYTKAKGMIPENISNSLGSSDKISLITSAMLQSGANMAARKKMMTYVENAQKSLHQLELGSEHLKTFEKLVSSVTDRTS